MWGTLVLAGCICAWHPVLIFGCFDSAVDLCFPFATGAQGNLFLPIRRKKKNKNKKKEKCRKHVCKHICNTFVECEVGRRLAALLPVRGLTKIPGEAFFLTRGLDPVSDCLKLPSFFFSSGRYASVDQAVQCATRLGMIALVERCAESQEAVFG